jgi:hypothetical protein
MPSPALRSAALALLLAVASCRPNPLAGPLESMDAGGCRSAAAELERVAVRQDRWGRGARALLASCRYERLLGEDAPGERRWRELLSLMDRSIRESDEHGLPEGVEPVSAAALGDVVERTARLALEGGSPREAVELIERHEDVARCSASIEEVRGRALLELRRWGPAAVALERAGGSESLDRESRGRMLRLAAGAWNRAGQPEKALVTVCRARRLSPLDLRYPPRLIEEGREAEHLLDELIAAAVHGVLVQDLERDWEDLQSRPQAFNFFFDKRAKDFLEARDVERTLRDAIAEGGDGQLFRAAPRLLYHILNVRALNRAAAGSYAAALEELERAGAMLDSTPEADANVEILRELLGPASPLLSPPRQPP